MNFYLDIETAPEDHALIQDLINNIKDNIKPDPRAKDAAVSRLDKFEKLMDEAALLPLLNRIVAISYTVDTTEAHCIYSTNEKELVSQFMEVVREQLITLKDTFCLVTFNGHSFDLPVLRCKLAKYLIDPMGINWNPGKYAFDFHFDVRNALTNFDQYGRGTLEQWAMYFKVPVDYKGISGKDVPLLFENGKFDEIAEKGKTDIEILRKIHIRLLPYY